MTRDLRISTSEEKHLMRGWVLALRLKVIHS